ncbi:nitroreductase [Sphingobium sp. DEHP117]|uniref:nitroreductase n=1 Tax=Sphingobium sp. DEHP117 TaxID=2993436 RepID=UPI0027D65E86|nr:nitroreductase family protein [Sphingobium sp. DEHP117]MDQ4420701.1 nitroreductase [Sphingobium sp. DEHP117]
MTVSEAVATRRSVRSFLDTPVPLDVLTRVMDKARFAPSGCNFQPWEASILTGAPLKALQEKMKVSPPQDPPEYDFSAPNASPDHYARLCDVSERMYGALGIAREDKAARNAFMNNNIVSFGAPAVLLCYFPRFMGPPQWSDVGMWLQTVMLLLREEGLDSCPQEFLWMHARLIKEHIGVSDETHIFFCGIAIGYRDEQAPINAFERSRVPLDEQVRFIGF